MQGVLGRYFTSFHEYNVNLVNFTQLRHSAVAYGKGGYFSTVRLLVMVIGEH